MKLRKRSTNIYLVLILSLVLLIGVGYAVLSSNLKINGQTLIDKSSWDIHMEDINVTNGSVEAITAPTIDSTKTTINFTVRLTNPGDFYEFTVKEVNAGTIDAVIAEITKTGLTATQAKYLDYTVTYDSGLELAEKQLLKSQKNEYIRVKVAFKEDVVASDLPTSDASLNLSFSVTYKQAKTNTIAVVHPTCKRATVLHTEICNQTNQSEYCLKTGYNKGDTIDYGNLGTQGTLTPGDAFDCDVNGDGMYNPETERFYYVSGKDGNNQANYISLIYYNDVANGVPSNQAVFAYNEKDTVYLGPQTAMKQLPTTTQWKNVKLLSTTRNITDDQGTVRINNFSYAGYAARLLTVQELESACNIIVGSYGNGELDTCRYLLENTKYANNTNASSGAWLETPLSAHGSYTWSIGSNTRNVGYNYVQTASNYSVRPVIEVEKTKVLY